MTTLIRDEKLEIFRHGAGINSRSSDAQINEIECTDGQNFLLDPGNGEFRPRAPFDKVGTAPNGAEIRGFATLLKTDGTVSMLVQAGGTVYSMNDVGGFAVVGSVSASARLRGPKEANWALTDVVLITDLALQEEIRQWDGTTLTPVSFLTVPGGNFGAFRAKYCVVENERAFFANIFDNGLNFKHLLVGSKRGSYQTISTGDRPSSGLGEDAPFYLPVPQMKPINGLAFAFGVLAISQDNGAFEKLMGESAKDFNLKKLHDGSGSSGVEAVCSTGNDVMYGGPGRVESLQSTDKFGDVEWDDISFKIQPDITTFKNWTLVYNPRVKRIYCFPEDEAECWVLHTDFIGSDLSPWSRYVTDHPISMRPTAVMLCRDPADGLEYVFMGDELGNIYRLEGYGLSGDAGSHSITANRISKLFSAPVDTKAFHINGWLEHRKRLTNTATLRWLFQGEHVHDKIQEMGLVEIDLSTVYGDEVYYGNESYYGVTQEDRLVRRNYACPGLSNQFQVEISVQGVNAFAITELGARFDTAG